MDWARDSGWFREQVLQYYSLYSSRLVVGFGMGLGLPLISRRALLPSSDPSCSVCEQRQQAAAVERSSSVEDLRSCDWQVWLLQLKL